MKIFVPVITFFKTYIHETFVKDCKLDEIGVKISLKPSITPTLSPVGDCVVIGGNAMLVVLNPSPVILNVIQNLLRVEISKKFRGHPFG